MTASLVLALVLLWPLLLALRNPLRLLMEGEAPSRSTPRPMLLDGAWLSAPLPALALALWPGELTLTLEGWLLGADWRLDTTRRPWLAFSALLWGLAGLYARGYLAAEQRAVETGDREAFHRLLGLALLWPLTLAGNLLLILAEDIPSFYLGFAVMTFAAYGLVVHAATPDARLGGKAYLIMALIGEALLLGGLLWGAGTAESRTLSELRAGIANADHGLWMALLVWLGFGVKAGVLGLHVWLPLAHPVAPTPASAVLSGVMIKAGLLGWLSTLPLGESDAGLTSLGHVIMGGGLLGAFAGALLGVLQRHPKAVLAYSSVSQMGMLTTLVGVGLAAPRLWPALSTVTVLFAAHHGMTKGALFLGVGISEHPPRLPTWLVWLLLALPAVSLAGGLASGLATKWAMKSVLYDGGYETLVSGLSLAAVGTTLLVARALWCQWQGRGTPASAWHSTMPLGWMGCVALSASVPLWLPLATVETTWPPLHELPGLLWPLAGGLVVFGVGVIVTHSRHCRLPRWSVPGDLWWGYASLAREGRLAAMRAADGLAVRTSRVRQWLVVNEQRTLRALDALPRCERGFRQLAVPLLIGVAVLLLIGFWLG